MIEEVLFYGLSDIYKWLRNQKIGFQCMPLNNSHSTITNGVRKIPLLTFYSP